MSTPRVVVTVLTNNKHCTVHSTVLMQCIHEVTDGAWGMYLDLDTSEREWLKKIVIRIELMDDGTTPMELEVELHISSHTVVWGKGKIIRYTVGQITGKKPPTVANMVKSYGLRELRKAAEVERSCALEQTEALRATITRLSSKEKPIRRVV